MVTIVEKDQSSATGRGRSILSEEQAGDGERDWHCPEEIFFAFQLLDGPKRSPPSLYCRETFRLESRIEHLHLSSKDSFVIICAWKVALSMGGKLCLWAW